MKRRILLLTILLLLLGVHSAQAMQSPAYRLDWFTPLTGGGGGPTASAHYAANFTIGQTAINAANSSHYSAGLGYWYGLFLKFLIFLPLVLR